MTTTTNNNNTIPTPWVGNNRRKEMDYFEYMLEMEMDRIESIANAIEADSAPVEQLPEIEIDWENLPWEKF
jgi:hypothetical protein